MTPQQKIADYMHRRVLENLEEVAEASAKKGMSPIEGIFFAALWNIAQLESGHTPVVTAEPDFWVVGVTAQVKIEKYRVDFLLTVKNNSSGALKRLVVECDGHDFHERTKDQARKDRSRDRRLQELGYTVYRFTGAELYGDPVKCAHDVLRWAETSSGARS